jgi:FtsP/CotA-like multicopper oxidase with cupredoxin domain
MQLHHSRTRSPGDAKPHWQPALVAVLLAYAAVGWEQFLHARLFGVSDPSTSVIAHWLREGLLASPLALLAVLAGHRFAARGTAAKDLAVRALAVAGAFAILLAPAVAYHNGNGGGLAAHHAPAGGLEAASGLAGLALHAARDALLSLPITVPLMFGILLVTVGGRVPWRPPGRRAIWVAGSLVAASVLTASVLVPLTPTSAVAAAQVRTYFIAADPVDWNYAPTANNLVGPQFDALAPVYLESGPDRIGKINRKSLYREYTDATFSRIKPRPPQWQHLGALGPVIRAAVGDTIRVVFRNNTPFPASIHPHGVLYLKNAEGAPYDDGTSGSDKADDAVRPGGTFTYVWQVPDRAGPGPGDPSSMLWMYHSHVDEVADTHAGLIGPMIITRADKARADGSPSDVDRELVTFFNIYDENESPWLDENIRRFTGDPGSVDPDDEDFQESNLKHSINGYLYGNLPGLTMARGQRVRWYAFALGTETGMHTPHWHGHTLLWHGMRVDGTDLLPMSMKQLDMVPDDAGTWLYHCHVNDHLLGGMIALYRVS